MIKRFVALHHKHETAVDFSRAEVYMPVFNASSGQIVTWKPYRVIIILCYFGPKPGNDHCQCLYISSGSSWMIDNNRRIVHCSIVDPLRRAAYMYSDYAPNVLCPTDLSDLLATAFSCKCCLAYRKQYDF